MKKANGYCWQYKNTPARGVTWAAELRVGNALLCVYGQKKLKSAIDVANKAAKRLGWKMVDPWKHETREKSVKAMTKRRML